MQEAGLGGVLLFEMGARGPQEARPPSGPEFLSPAWTEKLHAVTKVSRSLGLQVDMSVISSWDLGGTWVTPQFASKALYPTEVTVTGGRDIDLELPFPPPENGVPLDRDGRPAFWEDVAVLAVRQARRLPGHSFVLKLFPPGGQELTEVVLDQGDPAAPEALAATMTPVREFSIAVSSAGGREADFTEVLRAEMPAHGGRVRFPLPAGTKGTHLRLTLLGGHDRSRRRWTLAEFEARTARGVNVAANRAFLRFHTSVAQDGATTLQAPMALAHREWNVENLNDGENAGPTGVFVSAGMPPFDLSGEAEVIDVTRHVDSPGPAAVVGAGRGVDSPALRVHSDGPALEGSHTRLGWSRERFAERSGHAQSHAGSAAPAETGVRRGLEGERHHELLPRQLRGDWRASGARASPENSNAVAATTSRVSCRHLRRAGGRRKHDRPFPVRLPKDARRGDRRLLLPHGPRSGTFGGPGDQS
jgi:hypothetical protein